MSLLVAVETLSFSPETIQFGPRNFLIVLTGTCLRFLVNRFKGTGRVSLDLILGFFRTFRVPGFVMMGAAVSVLEPGPFTLRLVVIGCLCFGLLILLSFQQVHRLLIDGPFHFVSGGNDICEAIRFLVDVEHDHLSPKLAV